MSSFERVMIETAEKKERVILVSVAADSMEETAASISELKDLVKTAGAEIAGTLIQSRERIHPATYIGSGKIEELNQMIYMLEVDGIVCDDELSPTQLNNLQEELGCKVMDRTLVILDIFASRARTSEGKIQVELAQLRYAYSRLAGLHKSFSRLGGGIGTRGPGEKKLEIDRRVVSEKISALKKQLEEVREHRSIARKHRKKRNLFMAAIVGYTNSGKSTLLNNLTGSSVYAEDELFATLDPATRLLEFPEGGQILLTDTVGFIRKLPHHLIEAFKSTLEESVHADLIIHVVDSSTSLMKQQMDTVYETLDMLGASDKYVITLFNKIDKRSDEARLIDDRAKETLKISAKYSQGRDEVIQLLEKIYIGGKLYIERIYPFNQADKISVIRKKGILISEIYTDEGISIKAYVPMDIYGETEITQR